MKEGLNLNSGGALSPPAKGWAEESHSKLLQEPAHPQIKPDEGRDRDKAKQYLKKFLHTLEPSIPYPRPDLISDREPRLRAPLKSATEAIGIDLQRNAVVPAAAEEPTHVKLSEASDAA